MRNSYFRQPWAVLMVVWLLLATAVTGRAQVYYMLSDGQATTSTDELRRSPLAAPAETALTGNILASAGPLVVDAANNRVLIADVRNNQPRIMAVSLTSPYAVSTFLTPAAISGAGSTTLAGIAIDNANGYVYYALSDGQATTTTDELRRSPLASAAETTIASNFVASPGPLALDAANNRMLIADVRSNQPKIAAVSLTSPYAVSTFLTPAAISGATATTLAGIAVDRVNSFVYYMLSDGQATTTTDVLRRSPLASPAETTLTGNILASAGPLVVDLANNRVLAADVRSNQPKIMAVSLTSPYAVSTFLTPAAISGATATTLTGIALPAASPPTVLTTAPASITTTSVVLGGNVTNDGGSAVTDRGVVYSTSNAVPTTLDTKVQSGTGTGTFTVPVGSLTPGTTYYVRAYAINGQGTAYGTVFSFTTTPSAPTVATPANGSLLNTTMPIYTGTAQPNSTVTVYVDGSSVGTAVVNAAGNWSLTQPTALSQGSHTVRATAAIGSSAASADSNINTFTIDSVRPSVTITSSAGANGSTTATTPIPFTVTFSEAVTGFVAGDVSVTNGTLANFAGSGTTYTFDLTPATPGTASTVSVPAGVAQDPAGNTNTAATTYSLTYVPATATVVSVTRLTPSPTATAAVRYQVVFSGSVNGVTGSNFSLTTTGVSGASVSSVSGSGTTYIVTVNTGSGDGTLRLNVSSSSGISPSVTNLPYTSGEVYTITKSFAAQPQLSIQGTGGTGSDVTAFVDVVRVLNGGSPVANAVQNSSFETHDPLGNGNYGYQPTGASWTFNARSGIAEDGSAFTPIAPIPSGIAVAFVQSTTGINGVLQQNLALPTGSNYQVSFQTAQRVCCSTADQALNVFLNGVFLGTIQPTTSAYTLFSSATFAVTAPALTATISSSAGASGSTTAVSPIPFTVTFSQAVTGFTATGVTVTNGTVSGFAGSGTTYTFSVTPVANGLVTVNVPANSAFDSNNTGNTAASQYDIIFAQPVTPAPIVVVPANGSLLSTATPTYAGTAVAGSTVSIIVDGLAVGTTTANASGNWTFTQPVALAQGNHSVNALAQASGQAVSTLSNTNSFIIDSVQPTVTITSSAGASGGSTSTSPIPFTVTFSETVTGFVAGDVTVGNGTISGFGGSGTTYTFSVTPAGNGPVTVSVSANVAQDPAGNGNTAASPFSITYTAPATVSVWTGAVSTDWYTAGNWTAGVPTASLDATIPGSAPRMPLIGAGTATAKALAVNTGAALTQTGGMLDVRADLTNDGTITATGGTVVLGTSTLGTILGSSSTRFWNLLVNTSGARSGTSAVTSVQRLLTLNGNFSTQGNPLTLESDAATSALVVNNGASVIVGNVTVQRYIAPDLNPGPGYRHYSAPVATATVGSLATGSFVPVVNPAYNTSATPTAETPFPTVFGYDQARLASTTNNLLPFDKGWFSPASLADALTVGKGYTVNLAASQTLSVTGPQNNGTIAQTLGRNSGATAADAGWHLVGNPYPAPLDYSLVAAADRPNLDASMYVFESTSQYNGSYRAYVNGVGGNPVVAQGQGFFVRVSTGQTSGTLTMRNSHRVTAYQNPVYHRTAETRPLVQLDLQGAGTADPVYVYFENGATPGVDQAMDAVKLPNSHGLNVSAEAVTQRLAISALPALGTAPVTVPLTVGVPVPGSYSFRAAQLLNLSTTPVYLRDRQTGAVVDLRTQPSYSFVVSNASALLTGRFELVFSPLAPLATAPAALAAQVGVFPNPARSVASVELPAVLTQQAATVTLLDNLGRVVLTQTLPAGLATHRLPLTRVSTGVYALRLQTKFGLVVKKLVVE